MWSLYAEGVQSRIRACRAVGRMVINHFALVRYCLMAGALQGRTTDPAITDLLDRHRRRAQIVRAAWLQGRTANPATIHLLEQRVMRSVVRRLLEAQ